MKNVNKWFAAALVCLAFVVGLEHYRVSRLQSPTHKVLFGATNTDSATPALAPVLATTATPGLQSATDKTRSDYIQIGPRRFWHDTDDFFCAGSATGTASLSGQNTSAAVTCSVGWRMTGTGTAAEVVAVTTGQDATHFGILEFQTGSTNAGIAGIIRAPASTPNVVLAGGPKSDVEFRWMAPTLSDGTETHQHYIGWTNGIGTPTDGCFANYSSAAPGSGTIVCRTCAASSCTTGTGGTPPTVVAATWYRVDVHSNEGGTTCSCDVDGVNIGSTSSTFPSATLATVAYMVKTAGTTERTARAEYYDETKESTGSARNP
jgi:hypothetical protein